jgi:hypothetical protein
VAEVDAVAVVAAERLGDDVHVVLDEPVELLQVLVKKARFAAVREVERGVRGAAADEALGMRDHARHGGGVRVGAAAFHAGVPGRELRALVVALARDRRGLVMNVAAPEGLVLAVDAAAAEAGFDEPQANAGPEVLRRVELLAGFQHLGRVDEREGLGPGGDVAREDLDGAGRQAVQQRAPRGPRGFDLEHGRVLARAAHAHLGPARLRPGRGRLLRGVGARSRSGAARARVDEDVGAQPPARLALADVSQKGCVDRRLIEGVDAPVQARERLLPAVGILDDGGRWALGDRDGLAELGHPAPADVNQALGVTRLERGLARGLTRGVGRRRHTAGEGAAEGQRAQGAPASNGT